MTVIHLFAGIATADLASALEWYERLLGAPPDRFPHQSEAVKPHEAVGASAPSS